MGRGDQGQERRAASTRRRCPRRAAKYESPVDPRNTRAEPICRICSRPSARRRRSTTGSSSATRPWSSSRRSAVYLTSTGGEVAQRFRFTLPHMRVTANEGVRDAVAQPRPRAAGRIRAGGARRIRRQRAKARRGRAAAARGAELSVGQDGPAPDARPDDAADPRVHRPSAGARPHPRRRAQLRRHELRHARHVRHAIATAPSC